MGPVDISRHKNELQLIKNISSLKLIDKLFSMNFYKTRRWNKELATRYIYSFSEGILEASHYRHFMNDTYVKTAIELRVQLWVPAWM